MILEKDHSDQRGALSLLLCACVYKSALLAEEIKRDGAVRSRRVRRKIFGGSFEWWRVPMRCSTVDAKAWTHGGRVAALVFVRDEHTGAPIHDAAEQRGSGEAGQDAAGPRLALRDAVGWREWPAGWRWWR
ncbi:hypothetical protein ZWY2020_022978 [Hordeum vulgare]|nr:hypothetical protein ZWY2020_022978 [Hordeum vulgare]